jgi:hypothetical protein
VAVPVPGLVTETAAVKVTDWPATEGLGEAVNVVVVDAGLTTNVNGAFVLAVKFVSPPYATVSV